MGPQLLEETLDRSIRLHAYTALQEAKKLEERGEAVPEDLAAKAEHGVQLQHCDDQKRILREKGHFFHVHPHADKDVVFPVVDNVKGKIEPFAPVVPDEERKVKFSKSNLKRLGIKPRSANPKKFYTEKKF
jgi:hypothetical protein